VTIGQDCSVQAYSILVGVRDGGPITIGNGVRIAPHVMAFAANHVFADTDVPIHKQGLETAPIVIEDDVWIAGQVMITAGVRIGCGSVIGAGAVVTKDIPPWSVAAGVPARVIKTRKARGPTMRKTA
jgi:acetyltransferase-like isoleucine patch superfamily enzyme